MSFLDKAKGVTIGHAVADALGVPVEFVSRERLDEEPTITMEGFGTYQVPAGSWSDDSSMAIATMDALSLYGIDYDRIMLNFGRWFYHNEFTPGGITFDVGMACSKAINNYFIYEKSVDKCGGADEYSNGNGSLMRIYPVVLYLANEEISLTNKIRVVEKVSALTHAHERSKIGCGIYAFVLWELISNPTKESVVSGLAKAKAFYKVKSEGRHYDRLFSPDFALTTRDNISSSGYVVDTLEAAVWCLLNTNSYSECVLKAVNLGEDTDTVGAVAGALAGALYGYDAIPEEWRNTLIKRDEIEALVEKTYK